MSESEKDRSTPDGTSIYQRMIAVMADIGAVGKKQTNQLQHYKFRGIDQVYNALQPALVKYGVFVAPEVISTETQSYTTKKGTDMLRVLLTVRHTFWAEDGSSVEVVTAGEGTDASDKATNKAMSAAYKYAMFETFCIPTEDQPDADSESPKAPPKAKRKRPAALHPPVAPPQSEGSASAGYVIAEKPERPSWENWLDDKAFKSGEDGGKTWREMIEGSMGGGRYSRLVFLYQKTLTEAGGDRSAIKFYDHFGRMENALWLMEERDRGSNDGEEPS